MSIFVDTGVFYALQNQRATLHEEAVESLGTLLEGEYGTIYTSDYVYDETVTLVRERTGDYTEAKAVGDRILGRGSYPDAVTVLPITEDRFDDAVETFELYRDHSLSFTDASTIALVDSFEIDAVLSFDDDFDGLVERIDPETIAD